MTDHPNAGELDALFRRDVFAHELGVELLEWSGGTARTSATPTPAHCNFVGGVHGGYLLSVADVALSIASNSWGRVCVATSIDIHYHLGVEPGDRLVAHAYEISRGNRLASYRVEVLREDTLVASATGVTYRTSRWHLGAETWPEAWRAGH